MKSSEQAENSDKRASQGWLVEINVAKSLKYYFISNFNGATVALASSL